jgi:hypothetical protein
MLIELVVTLFELSCDHPDCAGKNHRVLKVARNIIEAHKLINAREVRCPVHGVRSAPLQLGRVKTPAASAACS